MVIRYNKTIPKATSAAQEQSELVVSVGCSASWSEKRWRKGLLPGSDTRSASGRNSHSNALVGKRHRSEGFLRWARVRISFVSATADMTNVVHGRLKLKMSTRNLASCALSCQPGGWLLLSLLRCRGRKEPTDRERERERERPPFSSL